MPLNTIVVNQGDLETNVPEGSRRTRVNKVLGSYGRGEDWTDLLNSSSSSSSSVYYKITRGGGSLSCASDYLVQGETRTNTSSSHIANSIMEGHNNNNYTQVPVISSPMIEGEVGGDLFTTTTGGEGCDDLGGFKSGGEEVASNKGWGFPEGSGLRGGGLNSLNNGTSGWGAPPSNANANTGWGTPPGPGAPPQSQTIPGVGGNPPSGLVQGQVQVGGGGQGQGPVGGLVGPPVAQAQGSSSPPGSMGVGGGGGGNQQWASTSPNRNTSQNTNGQPNISGSQMNNNPNGNGSGQGGPGSGNAMQMNNQNMVNSVMVTPNNPNSTGVNRDPNPPPQQGVNPNPANSGGIIPNTGGSSWAQAAGKSLQVTGGNPNGGMNPNQQGNPSPGGGNPICPGGTNGGGQVATTGSSSVTSKQIEQLNSMREALFSHDGWGGQNVNQDSSWDIPGSPEPTHKDLGGGQMSAPAGTSVWKMNVNNGTDLWEANLRGAPQPPPTAREKAPWAPTPANNIGGTWGEDDDGGGDQSNVWTGPASGGGGGASGPNQGAVNSNSSGSSGGGWNNMNNGPQQPPQREPNNGMWNSAPMKKETNEWGSGGGRSDGGRGGHGPHGGPGGVGDNRGGVGMVPHDQNNSSGRGWDDGRGGGNVGGRGINNSSNVDQNPGMWAKPQQPGPNVQQQPPNVQQQSGGWGGPPPVGVQGHMGGGGMGQGMKEDRGKGPGGSGWDDVSPPTQRRPVPNIPNYDDGTALWGNAIPGQGQQGGGQGQHPSQRGMGGPNNRGMPNKMDDGQVGWGGNRNNGWSGPDGPQDGGFNSGRGGGGGGWEDKSIGSWGEPQQHQQQQQNQGNSWGKPKTPTNNQSGWGDEGIVDTSNWGAPPKNSGSRFSNGSPNANSNTTKDPNWFNQNPNQSNNRNYKLLAEMGFKKEDIEMAIRTSSMNLSDAIDSLDGVSGRGGPPMDQSLWGGNGGGGGGMGGQRRGPPPPVDHDYDLGGLGGPGGPMGMLPPPQQQRGGYNQQQPNPKGFSGGNSLMNNVANPSLGSINPSLLQRILTTQQQPNNPPQPGRVQPNNGGSQGQFPFNKSVSVLVQQIQMAVQAGYLSNQILQHPLPPQSLVLLNNLLQQIKSFQMLSQAQQQMGNTNTPAALQISVQITKTKQHIQNLHNQIAAQQALHAKQQQQQQHQQHHHLGANQGNNDFFKAPPIIGDGRGGGPSGGNLMDPMSALQNNFGSDIFMNNKDGGVGGQQHQQQQQSRLHQWTKLPSLEKDDGAPGGDFSRAPGPQSNNGASGLLKNNSSLILGQSDNTWSTSVGSRSGSDGWPTDHSNSVPVSGSNAGMNMSDDPKNSAANMNSDAWQTDLVPEFEPGKPWKGTQILKSVDDDPTLTPGSVVRSPLSLATIKDAAEIFAKNASSSAVSSMASDALPLSLSSSSTWSYTPTSGGSAIANSLAKLNSTRDLWDYGPGGNGGQQGPQQGGGGQQQGSRPPPGLPKKQGAGGVTPQLAGGAPGGGGSSNSFRNNSWGGPGGPQGGAGGGNSYYWLLLRNLTPQIDGSTLKTLCLQHGPLQKFHLYLNHGVALVRYSTREEAAKAQNALNNCVLGNTTILAETAGENDVGGLLHGLNAATVNNAQQQQQQQQSNSGFSSQQGGNPNAGRDDNPWGLRDNSPLWSNNPWGNSGLDAPDRATPSSLNSLLPDGLLGGESA